MTLVSACALRLTSFAQDFALRLTPFAQDFALRLTPFAQGCAAVAVLMGLGYGVSA